MGARLMALEDQKVNLSVITRVTENIVSTI